MDGEQRQRVDRTRLIGIYLMLAGVLAIVAACIAAGPVFRQLKRLRVQNIAERTRAAGFS